MKKLLSIFASLTAVFLGSFLMAQAAQVFYGNQVGNSATSGYVLQSTGSNSTSNWVATSTLGISASGGSGTVSTSTIPTIGQIAYWTSNGFPSLLGSVATSSATLGLGLTGSLITVGSGNSLSIATSSLFNSASDWAGTWQTHSPSYFQNALTLTTSGTSGASTLVGATLNIPQYSGGTGSYAVATGTPSGTINGTNKVFTTPNLPLAFYVNGIYQNPADDYVVTGSSPYTETFSSLAPLTNSVLSYSYNSLAVSLLPLSINNGGTGTTTAPSYGRVLVGDSNGNYEFVATSTFGGSQVYPGAGIAVSTGSAWGTSLTDNSTNWNTAYTDRITSVTNDTNVTGSIAANALTLGWTGTLADSRISSASTWNAKLSALTGNSLTKGYFLVGNDSGVSQATSTMFISSTGQVGIGTTTPAAKLDVNGAAYSECQTLTDGATITVDWSLGNCFYVTLGGSRTLSFSNITIGQTIHIFATQGGSGSYTLTYPSSVNWPAATAPTLSTAVGKWDLLVFSTATSTATVTGGANIGY